MTMGNDDSLPGKVPKHEDDVEAAIGHGGGGENSYDDEFSDPFDIANTKNASVQTLRRWRVRFSPQCQFIIITIVIRLFSSIIFFFFSIFLFIPFQILQTFHLSDM